MRDRLTALARSRPQGLEGLLAATLVLSVGKGVFLATIMVYLLEIADLSALAATSALSLWGAASAIAALPAGRLIDGRAGRWVGVASSLVAGALIPVTTQVGAVWLLMLVMFIAGGFDSAANVARRALFAGSSADGVSALAWARTVSNIGFALGALVSVRLLTVNSSGGYATAYLLISGVYLLMALCFALISRRPAAASPPSVSDTAPSSRRAGYALAAATAILTIHTTFLSAILPLWITQHTTAPLPTLGWLVLINTLITIGGQIPVSRLAATTEGALRCFNNSAFWLVSCCVFLGLAGVGSTAWQVCMLIAATVALTGGELFEAAGEWGLSATLAKQGEHGFFQSACVVGEASQSAAGPLVVGAIVTTLPVAGWPILIGLIGAGRYLTRFIVPRPSLSDTALVGSRQ